LNASEKLELNRQIQLLIERNIQIANEQLNISKQLESDIENEELNEKISTLAKEKNEVFSKQSQLEEKLFT
jgi:hypothetical protein